MAASKVVVYAGPTIPAGEIRALLPAAQVRPPVARGDLLTEPWAPGDTAVIIDGYYRQRRSVAHKEILWLLQQGVEVIGAASMGALRAAELCDFGMRGVGSVFGMYAAGELDADDEVAVLHGPAEVGYATSTVALVNLRHGCRVGSAAELMPVGAGERIVAAAAAVPFTHRSWPELEQALDPGDHAPLATLRQMIGEGTWDLKRLDARAALAAVEEPAEAPAAAGAAGAAMTVLTHGELLAARSTRQYAPGRWMSDTDVLNAARLFDPDYPRMHEEVLTGLLAGFARAAGATLPQYARERLGVAEQEAVPARLASWLTGRERGQLPDAEQLRLIMVRVWPVWQSADWREAVLARLRSAPAWQRWTDTVVHADDASEASRRLVVPPAELCGTIFLTRWRAPDSRPELELARRGFFSVEELGRVVRRFFALEIRHRRDARR